MLSGGTRTSQTADTKSVVNLPETRVTGTPVVVSEQTFARDPVTANLVQLPQVQNVVIRQERPVYESRTQNVQLEITREVPKLVEKVVEYPVEVIVEKPVEQRITVDVVHEKVVDIPIEIVNEVQTEQIFLHPVEMIREKLVYKDSFIDKPIIQEVRIPKEYITTREVPMIVEVPTQVDRTVFQPIETQVSKRVEVRKTHVYETKDVIKEVQVPVDRIVDVQVPRYVDHVIEREEVIQMPGQTIKREIPQRKDVIIPKAVYREVEVPVDVLITQDGQRLELGRRDPSGRYPGLTSERSRSLSNQRLSGVTSSRNFQQDVLRPQNPPQIPGAQVVQRNSNRVPAANTTVYGSNPSGNITYSFGANGGLVPTQSTVQLPRGSNTNFRIDNDPRPDRGVQVHTTGLGANTSSGPASNLYRAPSSGNMVPHLGSYQQLSYPTAPEVKITPGNQTHYYSAGANYTTATSQPITQATISGPYAPTQLPQRLSGSTNGVVITSRPQQQTGTHIYTSLQPSSFQNNQPLDSRFTKETNPTLRFTQETTNNNLRFTNPDQSPRRLQDASTHSTPGAAQPTYSVGLSDRGSYAARNTGEVSRNLFSTGNQLNNSSSGEVIRELVPSTHRPAGAPVTASGLEPIQEVRNDSMQSSSLNGGYELGHEIATPPGRLGGDARQEPLSQPRFYVSEPRAGAPHQQSSSSSALHQAHTISGRPAAGTRAEQTSQQTTSRSGSVSRRVVSEQVRLPPGYREGEPAVYFHRDKVIPKYVEQIIEKYRDIPVERRVEVPYDTIREQIINNDIIQEREVEVIRRVPGPVEEEFVEREIEVLKVVERPIYMTKKVQIIKEIIVEKEVEEPHETFVEKVIEREVEVDVPINSTTQRASIVETPVDCTTRRRRRTSAVNERLRQNLRESVERSNSISRENAELHSRVRLLQDRKHTSQGESSLREEKHKQEYEDLKQQLEGLTDQLTELETVDRQTRLTHQPSSN